MKQALKMSLYSKLFLSKIGYIHTVVHKFQNFQSQFSIFYSLNEFLHAYQK
jgi:hypothetical protein